MSSGVEGAMEDGERGGERGGGGVHSVRGVKETERVEREGKEEGIERHRGGGSHRENG